MTNVKAKIIGEWFHKLDELQKEYIASQVITGFNRIKSISDDSNTPLKTPLSGFWNMLHKPEEYSIITTAYLIQMVVSSFIDNIKDFHTHFTTTFTPEQLETFEGVDNIDRLAIIYTAQQHAKRTWLEIYDTILDCGYSSQHEPESSKISFSPRKFIKRIFRGIK